MEEEKFTLLRRFQYSSEATIYQGKLESQGIEVFLRDQLTIDSNPFYSDALGGIRMFVKTEDFDKANEIIGDVSLYPVNDENVEPIICPKCGTEETEKEVSVTDWKSLLSYALSVLVMVIPFHSTHKHKCRACKFEYN